MHYGMSHILTKEWDKFMIGGSRSHFKQVGSKKFGSLRNYEQSDAWVYGLMQELH